jgi:hypothetical protein
VQQVAWNAAAGIQSGFIKCQGVASRPFDAINFDEAREMIRRPKNLVQRLRSKHRGDCKVLCEEAADELERAYDALRRIYYLDPRRGLVPSAVLDIAGQALKDQHEC